MSIMAPLNSQVTVSLKKNNTAFPPSAHTWLYNITTQNISPSHLIEQIELLKHLSRSTSSEIPAEDASITESESSTLG
jgi:hypothetical protein